MLFYLCQLNLLLLICFFSQFFNSQEILLWSERVLHGQEGGRLSHLIFKVEKLGQNLMRSPTDHVLSGSWGLTPNLCILYCSSVTLYMHCLSHFRSPPNFFLKKKERKTVAQNLLWRIKTEISSIHFLYLAKEASNCSSQYCRSNY